MRATLTVMAHLAALLALSQVHARAESAAPVHTRKSQFRIPYRYDAQEMQRLGAQEIRLYVSLDQGANWHHAATVPPPAGRFDFVAPGEGEYWFSVRTVDGLNRQFPPGERHEPGLKVIVDVTPPAFEVGIRQLEAGRVQISWRAEDPHIDTSTLRLEYLQAGSRQWQPVSVVPQAAGRTSWSIPHGGVVAVRGSIADFAANVARAEQQASIAPASRKEPLPPTDDYDEPIAENDTGLDLAGLGTGAAFSDEEGGSQLGPRFTPIPPVTSAGRTTAPAFPEIGGGEPRIPIRSDVTGRLVSSRKELPLPAVEKAPTLPDEDIAASPESAAERIVASDSFEIDYEIGDVGPSGVGAVEFYITPDGGRSWYKLGDDADRRSPFSVKVPDDGRYGFEIRVRSGVGLVDDPPQPGDAPSIVVVVDKTPPAVELYPIEQGQGAALNQVTIRWQARDANPAAKSVLLACSPSPAGPWTTIRDWAPDTGSYLWNVTGQSAPSLYVALSVRDAAGNVRREVTAEPIVVDLKKPSAKILGVKPPAQADRR
jgi:hypothetical protein